MLEGIICEKERELHLDLSKKEPETSAASSVEFMTNRGQFEKFIKRSGIHSVVRYRDATSSDKTPAEDYFTEFSAFMKLRDSYQASTTATSFGRKCQRTYAFNEVAMPGGQAYERLTFM